MNILGVHVDTQAFWLYVIIAVLVFLGLEVKGRNDFHRFFWRLMTAVFHPIFWLICAAKKL